MTPFFLCLRLNPSDILGYLSGFYEGTHIAEIRSLALNPYLFYYGGAGNYFGVVEVALQ